MKARKARRRPKATAPDTPPLAARVDVEREKVFKAMSVVAVVRAACLDSGDMQRNPRMAVDALQAAYDMLDGVAEQLELIRDEHGGVPSEVDAS